jgi:16S rRNA C967 or C1407 C5-methylase (RsmB/RsmF family)
MPKGETKRNNAFNEVFQQAYGERWPALHAAMLLPSPKVALWNRHVKLAKPTVADSGMEEVALPSGLGYYRSADPDATELAPPPRDEAGVPAYYLLDLASVLVVEALAVEPFHKVLDLCAAPGGKSVAISQYLTMGGELTSNELSGERNKRLKRTLQEYIPLITAHAVHVTQKDGTRWHNPDSYDRVLIDAPCSSERHLLTQSDGLAKWSPKVTATQAATQLTLLLRGLETVKVGGFVVYSTCSISPVENDDVITSALKRTRVGVEIVRKTQPGAEKTKIGASMFLPDTANGIGPMYCCVLRRTSAMRSSDDDDSSDGRAVNSGSDSDSD